MTRRDRPAPARDVRNVGTDRSDSDNGKDRLRKTERWASWATTLQNEASTGLKAEYEWRKGSGALQSNTNYEIDTQDERTLM